MIKKIGGLGDEAASRQISAQIRLLSNLAGAARELTAGLFGPPQRGSHLRDRVGDHGAPLERCVDLLGEVGERVGKRVVDGATKGLAVVHARELAEARVRADQALLVIENGDRERDGLEQGMKSRDLRAFTPSDVGVRLCARGIGHG